MDQSCSIWHIAGLSDAWLQMQRCQASVSLQAILPVTTQWAKAWSYSVSHLVRLHNSTPKEEVAVKAGHKLLHLTVRTCSCIYPAHGKGSELDDSYGSMTPGFYDTQPVMAPRPTPRYTGPKPELPYSALDCVAAHPELRTSFPKHISQLTTTPHPFCCSLHSRSCCNTAYKRKAESKQNTLQPICMENQFSSDISLTS